MVVAVIGAGASGLVAALQAAWNGAAVTLLERNATVGRKLLVTGGGRCNLTNAAVRADRYACGDRGWMAALLERFGVRETLAMLAEIGIPARKTDDGWYYPLSESAHSVVAAFNNALDLAGVALYDSARVTGITAGKQAFTVAYTRGGRDEQDRFDRVIVSSGGKAYPTLGSQGDLYPVLERLGHTVLPARPALAPLMVNLTDFHALRGVRLDVGAAVWEGSRRLGAARGNLIFTEWGLNGPAVMDLSHHVSARPKARLQLSLDLLAFFRDEFERLLAHKRASPTPARVFLGAFFPPKVAETFLLHLRLPADVLLNQMDDQTLQRLTAALQDTRLDIQGVRGFEHCQVSAGGVPVSEVSPLTLESLRVQGLYLTGETLDVVGPCGGYNLQYAFSSGALAGLAAAAS